MCCKYASFDLKMSENVTMKRPLKPKELQAARMLAIGYSHNDMAKQLEIHRGTAARWGIREDFKREVQKIAEEQAEKYTLLPKRADVHNALMSASPAAVQVLMDIMENPSTTETMLRLKKDAAVEILSRTGFSPIKQVNVNQTTKGGEGKS